MTFEICAQVWGTDVDRPNQVSNGSERVRHGFGSAQPFPDDVGFRDAPGARLRIDLRDEFIGKADSQGLHKAGVIRPRQRRNTDGIA